MDSQALSDLDLVETLDVKIQHPLAFSHGVSRGSRSPSHLCHLSVRLRRRPAGGTRE
jgi:hypothetical protein